MQVNQLFFKRQLVWQPPDAAQLAASWRVMVKTYGEQYAALQEQARGRLESILKRGDRSLLGVLNAMLTMMDDTLTRNQ